MNSNLINDSTLGVTLTMSSPTDGDNTQTYIGVDALVKQLRHTADLLEAGRGNITECELRTFHDESTPYALATKLTHGQASYPGGMVPGTGIPKFNPTNVAYVEASNQQQSDADAVAQTIMDALTDSGLEAVCVRQIDGDCVDVEGWTKDKNHMGWCIVLTHDNDADGGWYGSALLTNEDGDEFDERSFEGDSLAALITQVNTLVTEWGRA